MLRRFVGLLLVLLMAGAVACADDRNDAPAHPVFDWERDALSHWRLQDNGDKTDIQAHDIDPETLNCRVCGAEIWLYDDGSADLNSYNEQGELEWYASFDAEGNAVSTGAFRYEYDAAGCKTHEYQYENGVFVAQTAYAVSEDGWAIPQWSETYYDDGTWARNDYDAFGNCIKACSFDEEDAITSETVSEYALNDDGWYYEAKSTTWMEGATFISEYNQYGDQTYTYIFDHVEGTLFETRRVYEYKDGVAVYMKQYEKDVLVMESFCDEFGNLQKEIEYLEDGTTIVYEYDEEGNLIEE